MKTLLETKDWMQTCAMEQAREVWPGSASRADNGEQESVDDLNSLSAKLSAIIAKHAPASLEKEAIVTESKRLQDVVCEADAESIRDVLRRANGAAR